MHTLLLRAREVRRGWSNLTFVPQTSSERASLDGSSPPLHPAARSVLRGANATIDPDALHREGRAGRHVLDRARALFAGTIGVEPERLSFLSSGTEALQVALTGLRQARRRVGDRVLASAVDRSVILTSDPVLALGVDRQGRVNPSDLTDLLVEPTAAVVTHVGNHEVGTLQPVDEISRLAHDNGTPLLLDAIAALGRAPLPDAWDVLVADAQSFGGPPLGILAVRTGVRWSLPYAAEAEYRRALTTPWLPLIEAAEASWAEHAKDAQADAEECRALTDQIRTAAGALPSVQVVGDPDRRLPHIVTLSVAYVDGEVLVGELDRRGFAVASGSACTSTRLEPSHVLAAMGALTHGNIRITLPVRAALPDRALLVERFITELPDAVRTVRESLGVGDL